MSKSESKAWNCYSLVFQQAEMPDALKAVSVTAPLFSQGLEPC